jgi:hypothetical protein
MPDGGGGETQKQTTSSAPWAAQAPYLKKLFGRAEDLYQQGPIEYYPGETYAGMSPVSQKALQGITQRGMEGSPLNKASSGYLQDVLGGKYLSQEAPGFQAVANRARSAADSTYSGLGRYGSGAHDTAVADSVGNLAYQNYARERGAQDYAAGLAPTIAGQDFVDLNAVNQAGQQYQGELQNQINADMARYNFQQQAPYANLQDFSKFINGNYGGSSQTIGSGQQGAPWYQQALGGGLALASLFA